MIHPYTPIKNIRLRSAIYSAAAMRGKTLKGKMVAELLMIRQQARFTSRVLGQGSSASAERPLSRSESAPARRCGHPAQQVSPQAPSASSMMDWMVRAHRPHSGLRPSQP
jgi:hypothetical protein